MEEQKHLQIYMVSNIWDNGNSIIYLWQHLQPQLQTVMYLATIAYLQNLHGETIQSIISSHEIKRQVQAVCQLLNFYAMIVKILHTMINNSVIQLLVVLISMMICQIILKSSQEEFIDIHILYVLGNQVLIWWFLVEVDGI